MLTADYDRLGLTAGERMLDLGCGFGRHAYEALRRGAHVVACDLGRDELAEVSAIVSGMRSGGEIEGTVVAATVNGDATRLPFADASFDRIVASEVLEHVPADLDAFAELARVLRPGGMLAVTVPAWLSERICWALSDDYHAPAVEGGHLRIYTSAEVRSKLTSVGLTVAGSQHAHALHSPYWWLRCAVGPNEDVESSRLVGAYHKLLSWDIVSQPAITRLADRLLNPLIGKSLVVYAAKPAVGRTADAREETTHAAA